MRKIRYSGTAPVRIQITYVIFEMDAFADILPSSHGMAWLDANRAFGLGANVLVDRCGIPSMAPMPMPECQAGQCCSTARQRGHRLVVPDGMKALEVGDKPYDNK